MWWSSANKKLADLLLTCVNPLVCWQGNKGVYRSAAIVCTAQCESSNNVCVYVVVTVELGFSGQP